MSAKERRRGDADENAGSTPAGGNVEFGPGHSYIIFSVMSDILDKLKLLNYDQEFCIDQRKKPLNRHYFALQTNPGEQFYMFSLLAAWLIRKTGRPFDTPQESDDPNSTISNILDALRSIGVTVDFPPNKLKQGYGEQAVFVIDRLADEALKHNQFTWDKPQPQEDEEEEDDGLPEEDAAELTLDKIEEELMAAEDEDDDDDQENLLDLMSTNRQHQPFSFESVIKQKKPEGVLQSNVDPAEWQLELERVLPQLKVTVSTDNKDWRSHVEQMHKYRHDISESLTMTQQQLQHLHTDISNTLEKIGSREKYLNNTLDNLLNEYRCTKDRLAQTEEQYKDVGQTVMQKSQILAQLTDDLDIIKQDIDERGFSMTDGKPLVSIRKALTKLKNEISEMDVRIGVASHTLLQARLKERGTMQQDMLNFTVPSKYINSDRAII